MESFIFASKMTDGAFRSSTILALTRRFVEPHLPPHHQQNDQRKRTSSDARLDAAESPVSNDNNLAAGAAEKRDDVVEARRKRPRATDIIDGRIQNLPSLDHKEKSRVHTDVRRRGSEQQKQRLALVDPTFDTKSQDEKIVELLEKYKIMSIQDVSASQLSKTVPSGQLRNFQRRLYRYCEKVTRARRTGRITLAVRALIKAGLVSDDASLTLLDKSPVD